MTCERRNFWKLVGAAASIAATLGASADVLPDGELKHLLIAAGVAGTFISALYANVPTRAKRKKRSHR